MIATALAFLRGLKLSHIALIALAGLCMFLKLSLASEQRHSAKVEAQLVKSVEGRAADRTAYETAQREAAAKNVAQVAQIEQRQEAITNEVERDLNARLERLRSELRNPAAQGQAGRPGLPADGKTPSGTPQAPGVCLAPGQLLRAAENEERYDQLITWIEEQLEVRR